MKIHVNLEYPPIGMRAMDYAAYDEDRYDGAPDAGRKAQRVGHGPTTLAAICELAASACEDYTDEELDKAHADALNREDGMTLLFIHEIRKVAA